ncbi:MAG: flagellar hook basal-body protein [FCB group bacterium]|nr:flagellar hook basal-body protein [FCB group bacterium]
MNIELKSLMANMAGLMRKNDVIANNLANVNTNGFKRDVLFSEVLKDESDVKQKLSMLTDFSQGSLTQTDNPLDVAISGNGFFVVETDRGDALTRNGHFLVDPSGALITSSGNYVLGNGGRVFVTTDGLSKGEISITHAGEVYVDDELRGILRIVDVSDQEKLEKFGESLFVTEDKNLHDVDSPMILQGNLESANVNPVNELVTLIEIQRQFESSQRAIKSIGDALRKTANDVGRYR